MSHMCDVCDGEEMRVNEYGEDVDQDDDEDGPEPTYEEWVAANIGPRQVGGRYKSGYVGGEYTVLAIDPGPRQGWPVWQITVHHDGWNHPVDHFTAWDPERDTVLAEPDAEAAR
jgi:hypothetical protein